MSRSSGKQNPETAAMVWQRIDARRSEMDFSKKILAERSGISYAMILSCSKGARHLSLKAIGKTAQALGVDPKELLGDHFIAPPRTKETQRAKRRARDKTRPEAARIERVKWLKTWRKAHSEEDRRQDRIYKKLKRNNAYRDAWIKILAYYQKKCLACGAMENIVPDHVVPVGSGGDSSPGNLQPLCRSCNSIKRGSATDYRPDRGAWCASLMPAKIREG